MMNCELSFRNLPFVPEAKQVIFFDPSHHSTFDRFIRGHYDWLKEVFDQECFEFCYLPIQAANVIKTAYSCQISQIRKL